MATIEKLGAPSVFDPPGYSQIVKVTEARNLLFLAGQLAYDTEGRPVHPGDFEGQARAVFGAIKAHLEAAPPMVQVVALAYPECMIEVEAIAVL